MALENVRVAERFDRATARERPPADELRERAMLEEGLRELSETDALTGLPNRRHWDRALAELLRPAQQPVCVALIDLDRFKAYNDLHGHPAGDALLQRAAGAWRAQLRPGDVLARYGGEEFAVVLPRCTAPRRTRSPSACAGRRSTAGRRRSASRMGRPGAAASLVCRADEALYEPSGTAATVSRSRPEATGGGGGMVSRITCGDGLGGDRGTGDVEVHAVGLAHPDSRPR